MAKSSGSHSDRRDATAIVNCHYYTSRTIRARTAVDGRTDGADAGLLQMVLRFTSNQFFEHCSFYRLCSRRSSLRSLFQKHKFHVKSWKNELRHTCIIFSSILLQTSLSLLLTSPTKQVNNCHRQHFAKDK